MHELTYSEIVIRILLSVLLGGALGLERGLKNRPAGMRTYMLVCLGSCIVMMVGQNAYALYQTGDPTRIGAQVVSGIGFFGAGTIVVTRYNQIKGLTTAAGLWAAACVGLSLGMGFYEIALTAGLAVFIVLTLMHHLDFFTRQRSRVLNVYIELDNRRSIGAFLRYARRQALDVSNIQTESDAFSEENSAGLILTIKSKSGVRHQQLLDTLKQFEHIRYIEEI